jgi:hypothetical protein
VPTLVDGDVVLCGSTLALVYLARRYDPTGQWPHHAPAVLARVRRPHRSTPPGIPNRAQAQAPVSPLAISFCHCIVAGLLLVTPNFELSPATLGNISDREPLQPAAMPPLAHADRSAGPRPAGA